MTRLLVCGTRHMNYTHPKWNGAVFALHDVMSAMPPGSVLIHGGANGVDTLADRFAWMMPQFAEVLPFHADWKQHGRRAGPMRNQRMLEEGRPDCWAAFHHEPKLGRGTADMVRRLRAAGVPGKVVLL